jgi:predicted nucleotide-binding protein (sugar kinase/HSP70/actin superfamily)
MGAYGAALYAQKTSESTLLTEEQLKTFLHTSRAATCHGCTNNCRLTVNSFGDGKKFISGNQCERGLGLERARTEGMPNLHEFKRNYLKNLPSLPSENGLRGTVGLPMALGMYELYPFWHGIFTALGFRVVASAQSTRHTYEKGQFSIPSDTACYPAKLMHGHVEELIDAGVDTVFYPCLTYNVLDKEADNHYNCPVVAYYAELLAGNMESLKKVRFLYPYLNINNDRQLAKGLYRTLHNDYPDITKREIALAVTVGKTAYAAFMDAVRREGERAVAYAKENGFRLMILAGRPYHIDPEIGHGIDKLATSLGFVVASEDSICHLTDRQPVHVLNQWTYHARLYRAARYATEHDDTELVQLVSFGCGVDAITTDEIRSILEEKGKYYTQIKIDEITNLGAVRIRLRSLLGALEQ